MLMRHLGLRRKRTGQAMYGEELLKGLSRRTGTRESLLLLSAIVAGNALPAVAHSAVKARNNSGSGSETLRSTNRTTDRGPHHVSRRAVLVVAIAVAAVRARVVLEVRVVASLLGRDTAGGIVNEQHLEEVETLIVETGTDRGVHIANPLGEGSLEVGIRGHTWPDVLSRGAEKSVRKKSVSHGTGGYALESD
jgi:hypothetical protein